MQFKYCNQLLDRNRPIKPLAWATAEPMTDSVSNLNFAKIDNWHKLAQ